MNELDKLLEIDQQQTKFKRDALYTLGFSALLATVGTLEHAPMFGIAGIVAFAFAGCNIIAWDDAMSQYDKLEQNVFSDFSLELDTWQTE